MSSRLDPRPASCLCGKPHRARAERRADTAALAALEHDPHRPLLSDRRRDRGAEENLERPRSSVRCGRNGRPRRSGRGGISRPARRRRAICRIALARGDRNIAARGDIELIDLRSIAVRGLLASDPCAPLAEGKALLSGTHAIASARIAGAATRIVEGGWRRRLPGLPGLAIFRAPIRS